MAVLASAVVGGVATSQAPELAQQYRQRLGGAVVELKGVVTDFDADAAASGLSRQDALNRYVEADERFFADRGTRMVGLFERLNRLETQQARLEQAAPIARPLHLLTDADAGVLGDTVEVFRPAVPVTADGILYGLAGFLLGGGLARLIGRAMRRVGRANAHL